MNINLLKRLEKLEKLIPKQENREQPKVYKFTLDDWTPDDMRKVAFPEGRGCFDPEDETLLNRWKDTKWLTRDFIKLLTKEEQEKLSAWINREIKERGISRESRVTKTLKKA